MHLGIIPVKGCAEMPNKLFDYIAAFLPILVIGDNDSAVLVANNNIGWKKSFDIIKLKKFFKTLSTEALIQKSKNIVPIRDQFSKEYLYTEYVQLITSQFKKD